MTESFSDRQKSYEESYDLKIIGRIPIIIRTDARSFRRISRKLERPYSQILMDIMGRTMLQSISEIDGAVFGYHYSDEILFILMPGDQPWYQNRIQKLCSVTSSIVSINFLKYLLLEDSEKIELEDDVVFSSDVYPLPSINEAVNHLIWRQQNYMRDSVSGAALAELTKAYNKDIAIRMLHGKKTEQKMDLLLSECDIDYEEYYPKDFRLGVCAYKVPKIIRTKENEVTKNKWVLDTEIPVFVSDRDFVSNILYSGHDVFRADRDLIEK